MRINRELLEGIHYSQIMSRYLRGPPGGPLGGPPGPGGPRGGPEGKRRDGKERAKSVSMQVVIAC